MTPFSIDYDDDISSQSVHIDIILGNLCNWSCSYCPTHLHDGSDPWLDKDALIKFLKKSCQHYKNLGKKYFDFNFLGGETSLYKNFIDITKWIKDQDFNSNIEIMTNGYRKLSYWKDNIQYFDTVRITHHVENADPYQTKTLADFVVDCGKFTSVGIPMLPNKWQKSMQHVEIILDSKHKFDVSPKTLLHDFGVKNIPYDYSEDQKKTLKTKFRFNQLSSKNKKYRKGINPGKLIANGDNKFKNYTCYAGIDIIGISRFGELRLGGNCKVASLGFTGKTIYDDDIVFPTKPVICTQEKCSCLPDVQTKKYLNV